MRCMDERIVRGTVVNDRLVHEGEKIFYHIYKRFPIVFSRAEGVYLYDTGGNAYLDFGAGISVAGLGYGNALLNRVMKEQIDSGLLHSSNLFYNEPSIEAGEKLLRASEMERVFFTNSGTEAIEGALKLARRYQYNQGRDRTEIIAFENSFHGRSMGALSVTGKEAYRTPFGPLLPGVRFARFNDLDSVREKLSAHSAAILIEPIQGEGGIYPATEEFLRGLREICDERDMLLLFDEIQCGMGRTGSYFCWQQYGVKPDVLTVAKALGNGVPIGAFLACGPAATAMQPGDHGSTFGGNPLVCAAASAVLDIFREEDIPGKAARAGAQLWEVLEQLRTEFPERIVDHRGRGLLQGLEFRAGTDLTALVSDALCREKLVLIAASHSTIRFVPPLIISRAEIEEMGERLRRVLGRLEGEENGS